MSSSRTTSGSWSKLGSTNNFTGSDSSYFSGGGSSVDWSKAKDLQNPFDLKNSPYKVQGDYDFKSDLGKDAFKGEEGKSESKPQWGKALGLATSYFDKAVNKGEQDQKIQQIYNLGDSTRGFGGQLMEGFAAIQPSQHAPIVIPGVQSGSSGKGAGIGRLAGTVLGLGASALIPGIGP